MPLNKENKPMYRKGCCYVDYSNRRDDVDEKTKKKNEKERKQQKVDHDREKEGQFWGEIEERKKKIQKGNEDDRMEKLKLAVVEDG